MNPTIGQTRDEPGLAAAQARHGASGVTSPLPGASLSRRSDGSPAPHAIAGDPSGWLDLAGRVCVVTGGGSGIGAAIAAGLAAVGARVAVVDRDAAAELVAIWVGRPTLRATSPVSRLAHRAGGTSGTSRSPRPHRRSSSGSSPAG